MKNLQALFVAAATVVLASVSHAAVSTTGQSDPSVINASGTIVKYVDFGFLQTTVDLNLGSPTYSGEVSTLTDGGGAGIYFSANTHMTVVVTNGADLSTNEG